MTNLLVIREQLRKLYGEKTNIISRTIKFLSAIAAMMVVNMNIGSMEVLENPAIIFVLAIVCAFIPGNFMVGLLYMYIVGHFYAISVEMAALLLVFMIIMYIFYFRFCPKDYKILIITPLMFFIKIPFAVPVIVGLVSTPFSIISVAFGTIIYFIMNYAGSNLESITAAASADGFGQMTNMINGVFKSNALILTILAFSIVIAVVYVIRRLAMDYSYMISLITGSILCMIIMLIADLKFDMNETFSVVSIIIGGIISIIISIAARFFVHGVDYSRTEHTQFEDDDYYYYVKAVPKIKVTTPEVNIKRINARKVRKTKKA